MWNYNKTVIVENTGRENKYKITRSWSEQDLVDVFLDMKDHNYLTSHNKVNGLIIEDAWRSREPYMTDACIWFGWHREWVWQYLNNSDSPYTDGGGNQFALGCFYRSRWMSVIPASSHFWGSCVIYFMLLWCMCLWVTLWVITHTIICMKWALSVFSFFGFSDESL